MAGKEIKKMKFFGYEKDSEKLMKLSEATFDGTLEELEDLIDFLKSSSIVRVKGKRVLELFCVEIKFLIDLDVGKTKSFFLNSICFNIKISSYSINNKTSCNNPVI